MARNNLILNNEWKSIFTELPDEDAGRLIKAVFSVHAGEDAEIENPMLRAIFSMMSEVVLQNKEAYEEKCKKNSEIAKAREEKRAHERTRTYTNVNERERVVTNKRKEIKEIKEINKKDIVVIVDYLNAKLGSKYRPTTRKIVELINARINEGATVDDFKTVIDKKYDEWHTDQKMAKFLRPDTLFGTKFDGYLNQPVVTKKNKFQNFENRQDQENKDLVAQVIAMNGVR